MKLTSVDGDGETFDRGDGEGSEQRADADVDEDVRPAKPRTGVYNKNRTQHQHDRRVDQETYTHTHTRQSRYRKHTWKQQRHRGLIEVYIILFTPKVPKSRRLNFVLIMSSQCKSYELWEETLMCICSWSHNQQTKKLFYPPSSKKFPFKWSGAIF